MECKISTTQHSKEVVMESLHRAQTNEQLGLFDTARVLPRWESLPPRVCQEVVQLLEKMLVDYGCRTLGDLAARKEPSNE